MPCRPPPSHLFATPPSSLLPNAFPVALQFNPRPCCAAAAVVQAGLKWQRLVSISIDEWGGWVLCLLECHQQLLCLFSTSRKIVAHLAPSCQFIAPFG